MMNKQEPPKLEFENQGGNSRETIYALYDYRNNPYGDLVITLEYRHKDGSWWFMQTTKNVLTREHMNVIHEFLGELKDSPLY